MQINCKHGYFEFREDKPGEIARFSNLYGLSFVSKGSYFTFEALDSAPDYSIAGNPYLGATATETFAGDPSEVLKANSLIFDFTANKAVNLNTITKVAILSASGFYYISPGLILPGSVTEDGKRVTDYAAWFLFESQVFQYSEVSFV